MSGTEKILHRKCTDSYTDISRSLSQTGEKSQIKKNTESSEVLDIHFVTLITFTKTCYIVKVYFKC